VHEQGRALVPHCLEYRAQQKGAPANPNALSRCERLHTHHGRIAVVAGELEPEFDVLLDGHGGGLVGNACVPLPLAVRRHWLAPLPIGNEDSAERTLETMSREV